jgi:hypothetical protein
VAQEKKKEKGKDKWRRNKARHRQRKNNEGGARVPLPKDATHRLNVENPPVPHHEKNDTEKGPIEGPREKEPWPVQNHDTPLQGPYKPQKEKEGKRSMERATP